MNSLMTVKEAAAYLRLNYMTLYRLAREGKIPASKVGGNWRFKKTMLDQWLSSKTRTARGEILIVDDDPRIQEVIKDFIALQGYKAITAGSGTDAIRLIEKKQFDLIFLDLVLPDLSGIEVMRKIKARNRKAVIIIVTGYGDDPIALEAMSFGPLLLLRKPLKIADIMEVLDMTMKVSY
jgi:excisionase family DNA binding protein